jgi:hypothetical protein
MDIVHLNDSYQLCAQFFGFCFPLDTVCLSVCLSVDPEYLAYFAKWNEASDWLAVSNRSALLCDPYVNVWPSYAWQGECKGQGVITGFESCTA